MAEFKRIWADGHQVEGTRLYVLELLMFGFAYSSRFILLKSKAFLSKLDDDAVREAVLNSPSRFGKNLAWGKQLDLDKETNCIYYIGEVKAKDIVQSDMEV